MPTIGAYSFKRAAKADARGVVSDEKDIAVGEWAWICRTLDWEDAGVKQEKHYLLIYLRDPDCCELATLWRRFGSDIEGHDIDAQGNIHPSVWHKWQYGDPPVERCGFHTQPTTLLDFVDLR